MATFNNNFKVKNGLDAGGNISTTGSLNVNTSGTGTLNLGDAQISKAPGSGFTFTSGIGSLTSLGIGTAANNASPLSVFFDTATKFNIFRGAANQNADILQIQSSAGTVLSGITANGLQYIGSTTSLRFLNYTLTVASASSTTVATYTTSTVSTVNPVVVGQKVIVSGVTPSSYNGSFNVTAIGGSSGAWTFTVTAPSAPFVIGSATGFGTFSVDTGLSIQTSSAGAPGLIIRAVASQAANILEYRRSDNSLQTYITPAGDFVAPAISAIWSMTSSAQDATVNAMRARTSMASGYRANLQTWENQTTVLAGVNSPGKFFTGSTTGITAGVGGTIQSIATGANPLVTMASAHGLAVGDVVVLAGTTGGTYNGTFFVATVPASTTFTITSALTTGQAGAAGTVSVASQVSVTARSAGVVGQVIRAAASQTSDLLQAQDSSGNTLLAITSSGGIGTSGLTALRVDSNRNLALNSNSGSYGSGAAVTFIGNATSVPSTSPTGGGILFVNSGALQYRGTSGGNATIVNADGTIAGYTLPAATSTALGGIELFSDTQQSVAANAVSATASRTYGVQLNAALQGVVNVPWTDTVYTAPTLAGTTLTSGGTITTLSGNLTTGGLTSTAAVNLNYASPTIASNNASAASIFTSTVTGVTIGSSTIRTTEFPADGTTSTATAGAGYMGLPQNATTTGAYTIVAADAGKHIYASATRTVTINSNANLALPVGTTLTFIAGTGATMTIAITSDTLILAGPGTTGSRTLAPFGMATAVKITSTSWIISGNGLT